MTYDIQIVLAFFKQEGLPYCVPEFTFCDGRRWRFDFAFPDDRVAVEVQGGIFIQGRHSRGAALLKEWEKLNHAAMLGWRVMYCQPKDICTMDMVRQIKTAICRRS